MHRLAALTAEASFEKLRDHSSAQKAVEAQMEAAEAGA